MWIFAHPAPAEVVATAHAAKAGAPPSLRRPHDAEDLFGHVLHPLGEASLVLPEVAGDAYEGQAEPALVAMAGIQVLKVGAVGERFGLEPDRADVLPPAEVVLIPLAPSRDVV